MEDAHDTMENHETVVNVWVGIWMLWLFAHVKTKCSSLSCRYIAKGQLFVIEGLKYDKSLLRRRKVLESIYLVLSNYYYYINNNNMNKM